MLTSLRRFALFNGKVNFAAVSSQFDTLRWFSSKADFEAAQANLKTLKEDVGVDVKLKLYALFKQASQGNVEGKRPGALDFAGRAKYDAWKALDGTSQDDAEKQYVELVSSLCAAERSTVNGGGESGAPSVGSLKPVEGIRVSVEGKVFRIELSRPEKFNAITWKMYDGIADALDYSSNDTSTSVTVITGSGDYYSSGNDLSNFAVVKSPSDMKKVAGVAEKILDRYVTAFINHQKPLIALVNGPAIGIAVTVLPLFDFVLASDKATFHAPFATLGQSPEGCSSYTFPILMGHLKAAEVLMFGRKMTAYEAVERNLVNEVFPAVSFRKEAEKRVEAYSKLPPETLRLNKQFLRSFHKDALMACNQREVKFLAERWLSQECIQALQQFMTRKDKK